MWLFPFPPPPSLPMVGSAFHAWSVSLLGGREKRESGQGLNDVAGNNCDRNGEDSPAECDGGLKATAMTGNASPYNVKGQSI